MNNTIRLFTGLAVPEPIRRELSARLSGWRSGLAFERWTHPEDWHITLHFLGDVQASSLPAIHAALNTAAAGAKPIPMAAAQLGIFGAPERPSVLWLGLAKPLDGLHSLHQLLGESLRREIGFEAEKREYRPHLTLARKFNGRGRWNAELLETDAFNLSWIAREAVLFESRLGRKPMYEAIARSPLGLRLD